MPDDMKDDEFAGGADIFEIFNEDLDAFRRIGRVISNVNDNAVKMAA